MYIINVKAVLEHLSRYSIIPLLHFPGFWFLIFFGHQRHFN
jgi:hypothetical protein